MAVEVTYKLRACVNNGVLVELTDFLKLPKVIQAGVTLQNVQKFICPASLHIVANLNSKSSPVRIVIAPHRPHMTTKQSINDALYLGHYSLPSIQKQFSDSD